MALQNPVEPKPNNEPLHRESAVDQSGSIRPWFRNWLEQKRLQIGEIISGVNRNAENIVQLQTDYEAADGAISSAYAAADAVVSSDAAGARAALQTTIEAAYEAADAALQANIDSEESARVSADAAEATARTALQATLQNADSTLQSNIDSEASTRATADSAAATDRTTIRSEFAAADTATGSAANSYTDAQITTEAATRAAADTVEAASREVLAAQVRPNANLLPNSTGATGVDGWVSATGITLAATDSPSWGRYIAMTAADWSGFRWFDSDKIPVSASVGYTVSMDILRFATSGTMYFQVLSFDSSGTQLQVDTSDLVTANNDFSDDPDDRLIKSFTTPAGTTELLIRVVTSSISGPIALGVRRIKLEKGSTATLYTADGEGVSVGASVEVLKEAFVDSNGNAYAGIRLVAAASGSDPAIVELTSADGAANVRLGGDTEIDGDLVVNGTITTEGLATNAVTSTENDQDDSALTPVNNTWTDVADFSFTSVGIGVQLRGSCEVDIFTDGTSPTAQVRILRDATVLKTSKVFAAVDAGSGFQKVEQSIALDYNDLPSSGTYTYKLQARLNEGTSAVVVSTFDVTNRFLSATELKR